MKKTFDTARIPIGLVGLGLMGCSITACLLMAGHPVMAVAPIPVDLDHAENRIEHLRGAYREGLIKEAPEYYLKNLTITEDYKDLAGCKLILECTLEDLDIKKAVYLKIETYASPEALLTSNTSAIPISILQNLTKYPKRFFGLHWMEPSHTTRFLEVICGDLSDKTKGQYLYDLAHCWQKEPTLLLKDIR